MILQNHFSKKIPANRLRPNSELLSFFNIQSILNKEHKTLVNLAKMLLCLSSFCFNKGNNLKKISELDLSLVQIYYDSVYLFLEKNTERKLSNNNSLSISELEEKERNSQKEMEKLKKLIEEKDLIIKQYKSTELIKNDISVIQSDQDFLGGIEEMAMNLDLDFDLKNSSKNYKIEKNDSFSFEKIITNHILNDSTQKNTNNSINSTKNFTINNYNFYLSGGNFLHKKIDILDDTIIKNREMYQKFIGDLEKQIEDLKQKIESLKKSHSEEIAQINLKLKIEIEKIMKEANGNNSQELIRFTNEKNNEIEKLKKIIIEKENANNKEIEQMKNKVMEEKKRMEKEIESYNLDNMKIKNEYEKKLNDLNNRIRQYENKIIFLEKKLKSDPYLAREIMSKTIYDLAFTLMKEK